MSDSSISHLFYTDVAQRCIPHTTSVVPASIQVSPTLKQLYLISLPRWTPVLCHSILQRLNCEFLLIGLLKQLYKNYYVVLCVAFILHVLIIISVSSFIVIHLYPIIFLLSVDLLLLIIVVFYEFGAT